MKGLVKLDEPKAGKAVRFLRKFVVKCIKRLNLPWEVKLPAKVTYTASFIYSEEKVVLDLTQIPALANNGVIRFRWNIGGTAYYVDVSATIVGPA